MVVRYSTRTSEDSQVTTFQVKKNSLFSKRVFPSLVWRVPLYPGIHTNARHEDTMESLAQMIEVEMDAMKVVLLEKFQTYLDAVLVDIAAKHELDLGALQAEYLAGRNEIAESALSDSSAKPKSKPKRTKKADDERVKCEAKTAKGAACKNFALAGCKFCACHNKEKAPKSKESRVEKIRRGAAKAGVKPVSPPSSDSESEVESPVRAPPKRPVRKAAAKPVSPMKVPEIPVVPSVPEEHEEEMSVEMKQQLDDLFGSESGSETEGDE